MEITEAVAVFVPDDDSGMMPDPSSMPRIDEFVEANLPSEDATLEDLETTYQQVAYFLRFLSDMTIAGKLIRGAHAYKQYRDYEEEHGSTYAAGLMDDIVERFEGTWLEREKATFYAEMNTFKEIMKVGTLSDLQQWIDKKRRFSDKKQIYWNRIEEQYTQGIPPEVKYGSTENAANKIAGELASQSKRIEEASDLAERTESEIAKGAAWQAEETMEMVAQRHGNPHREHVHPNFECQPYLDWLSERPCFACGSDDDTVVAHHVYSGVMGDKKSDLCAIPLCFDHHTGNEAIHTMGIDTFARRFGYRVGRDKIIWPELFFEYTHWFRTGYCLTIQLDRLYID